MSQLVGMEDMEVRHIEGAFTPDPRDSVKTISDVFARLVCDVWAGVTAGQTETALEGGSQSAWKQVLVWFMYGVKTKQINHKIICCQIYDVNLNSKA